MKHGELLSIAHNVADSLASGIGLMIGVYDMDVFAEAAGSPGGVLTVDILQGSVLEGEASKSLRRAIRLYRDALAPLFAKHRGSLDAVRIMEARFWSDGFGPRFSVTVEDANGRRSTADYAGLPGKRLAGLDRLGRVRRKPVKVISRGQPPDASRP
jgi:hypothetical protein